MLTKKINVRIQLFYDCTIQEKTVSFEYENMSLIMNLLNKYNAKIISENHGNMAKITFEINK